MHMGTGERRRVAEDIKTLLRELARPRLTGSSGAQEVRDILRARFTALGFQFKDYPFSFSTIPGRFSVTVAGALYLLGTLGAAAMLNMKAPGIALSILLLVMFVVGAIAAMAPSLSAIIPFKRVSTANMLAFKPGSRPRFLLVAHLDSKSQPLPLAFRGPAMLLGIITWIALVIFTILGLLDAVWLLPRITTLLSVLAFLSGVLCIFCWVDNRSPGALDNASGLAALLGVAEQNRDVGEIGYLITDAEEMGLAGARDIARKLDPVIGIINVDGLDDVGPVQILEKFGMPPRHIAPHLVAALLAAAEEMSVPANRRNVPFGLLLDHIPLARRHLPAVTVMRGTIGSMLRVHRPGDSADALNGKGVESVVALLNRALAILRSTPAGASL